MAVVLAMFLGCGRQPVSSTPNPAAPAEQTSPDNSSDAQMAALLAELTQLVRRFAAEQRRAPTKLEELVASGYLSQVPPAPSGKRFAIDKKLQVTLVSQ